MSAIHAQGMAAMSGMQRCAMALAAALAMVAPAARAAVPLQHLRDGSLLVSDDDNGVIYRITYK